MVLEGKWTRRRSGMRCFTGWRCWDIGLVRGLLKGLCYVLCARIFLFLGFRWNRIFAGKLGKQLRNTAWQDTERRATADQNFKNRFSRDRPRFTDTLDVIKFLCKDLWMLVFRKQIDNLKTNHRVSPLAILTTRFLFPRLSKCRISTNKRCM